MIFRPALELMSERDLQDKPSRKVARGPGQRNTNVQPTKLEDWIEQAVQLTHLASWVSPTRQIGELDRASRPTRQMGELDRPKPWRVGSSKPSNLLNGRVGPNMLPSSHSRSSLFCGRIEWTLVSSRSESSSELYNLETAKNSLSRRRFGFLV
ncbi:hypothetical protein F2Q68_00011589 [Brassica cretica]|uniref:Uncharacterized protein n=1 Tax=Brassica cretica TaxID=69181 RepID=A0A8S9QGZ8_BRACR|nr:hypothetical protein F2Q68_00011589 [Brassica cretica]KAF3541919.1 hypothetical protein F2Q69_00024486 [Brassica cretica]